MDEDAVAAVSASEKQSHIIENSNSNGGAAGDVTNDLGGKAEADSEIEEQIEVEQNSEIEGADEDYVYSDDFELSDGELSDIEDNDVNMYVEKKRDPNPELPETVTLLETSWGSKVYLVGTAHFSAESQEDVAKTIVATQPDVVLVELCNSRMNILQYDEETLQREAKDLSMAKMKQIIQQSGLLQGVMHVLLLKMTAHLTEQLGMAPGESSVGLSERPRRS